MEPWVRGWGADVEVLAPAELRASVVEAVRAEAEEAVAAILRTLAERGAGGS